MSNTRGVAYDARMIRTRAPLTSSIRHHRGVWLLVALVLLTKLASGTICMADGLQMPMASTTVAVAQAVLPVDVPPPSGDDSTCLLGEAGGCHCACAHSSTLPTTSALPLAIVEADFAAPRRMSVFVPGVPNSLLRPPIA